jgi:hypothetical protein
LRLDIKPARARRGRLPPGPCARGPPCPSRSVETPYTWSGRCRWSRRFRAGTSAGAGRRRHHGRWHSTTPGGGGRAAAPAAAAPVPRWRPSKSALQRVAALRTEACSLRRTSDLRGGSLSLPLPLPLPLPLSPSLSPSLSPPPPVYERERERERKIDR